jgi:hypothetical protein
MKTNESAMALGLGEINFSFPFYMEISLSMKNAVSCDVALCGI